MRRLVIIKTGDTIPSLKALRGDFEDWILAGMRLESAQAEVVDVAGGQPLPQPAQAGGIVITGSHDMVTDRLAWSERTASWLSDVVASGTPTLGICYGHQLLAHALGGRVDWNPRGKEMGTTSVTLLDTAFQDPLLGGLPATIEVHLAHSQSVVSLPPGAVHLAANAWDPHQAFRVGDCAWGVQFHPEFDAGIMRAYAEIERPSPGAQIFDTPIGGEILRRFASLAHLATREGR